MVGGRDASGVKSTTSPPGTTLTLAYSLLNAPGEAHRYEIAKGVLESLESVTALCIERRHLGHPAAKAKAAIARGLKPALARPPYARDRSSPSSRRSLGRSRPMNTILLKRSSSAFQAGPGSLPMIWCTPWKITLRSVPFMFSTPL